MTETTSPDRAAVLLHLEPDAADGLLLASVLRDVWRGTFRVIRVAGLRAALSRLQDGGVDCVLLDPRLPDADGLDAVEQLTRAVPRLPVVVLTDHDEDDLGVRAVRAGAQDFPLKGTDGPALSRAPRYAIVRKRREVGLAGG